MILKKHCKISIRIPLIIQISYYHYKNTMLKDKDIYLTN
nr:MAG TPA: hypothetical protein [Caudoviricetes sp.]